MSNQYQYPQGVDIELLQLDDDDEIKFGWDEDRARFAKINLTHEEAIFIQDQIQNNFENTKKSKRLWVYFDFHYDDPRYQKPDEFDADPYSMKNFITQKLMELKETAKTTT